MYSIHCRVLKEWDACDTDIMLKGNSLPFYINIHSPSSSQHFKDKNNCINDKE